MPKVRKLWLGLCALAVVSLISGSCALVATGIPTLKWHFGPIPVGDAKPVPTASVTAQDATPSDTQSTFQKLLAPFIDEANKRRAQRAETDPEFASRVDLKLNDGRVNFLFLGQGETFEPPFTKVGIIGSPTIMSYDIKRNVIDLVSITHDTRAPEIERYLQEVKGEEKVRPIKIDQAYHTGSRIGGTKDAGFALMRKTIEDATGLSVDFQVVFWDDAIVDMINKVFGKVEVVVPKTFRVNPFYFRGKEYPAGEFKAGEQELDGLQAIQFIKTVVIETGFPDRELEHNTRKHLLFRSMSEHWQGIENPVLRGTFLGKLVMFLIESIKNNRVTYDFDPISLLIYNIWTVADSLKNMFLWGSDEELQPPVGKTLYIADWRSGDGGVEWVNVSRRKNHVIEGEFARGHYLDVNMEVPVDGDPYAKDLATGYWLSVRKLVKNTLTMP